MNKLPESTGEFYIFHLTGNDLSLVHQGTSICRTLWCGTQLLIAAVYCCCWSNMMNILVLWCDQDVEQFSLKIGI